MNITFKDFLTIDMNLDSIIKLDDLDKEDYLRKYILYMNLLIEYLIKKTDIKKYDDLLKEDSHNFISIKDKDMDIYQKLGSNYFKYFYIRNNLHLDRLTKEEDLYLNKKDIIFDDKTYNFIESTFEKVIFEDSKDYLVNYGVIAKGTLAPSKALVIGVRYDEFNLNGMSDIDWDLNYQEQTKILNKIIESLESNIKNNLNIDCKIIKYNRYSVFVCKE